MKTSQVNSTTDCPVVGKTYIFNYYGRVEREIISVGDYVVYRKKYGFGQCSLKTFQRLYKQYGVEDRSI